MPLWTTTARILQSWFHDLETGNRGTMAFPNARGNALTRDGVQYLLQRAVQRAVGNCSSLADKRIHPHLLRHASAYYTTFPSSFILKTIGLDRAQSVAVYGRYGRLALEPARRANQDPFGQSPRAHRVRLGLREERLPG